MSDPDVCYLTPGERIDQTCRVCGHVGYVHTRTECSVCEAIADLRKEVTND